jgi:hypothetical protein
MGFSQAGEACFIRSPSRGGFPGSSTGCRRDRAGGPLRVNMRETLDSMKFTEQGERGL